MFPWPPLPPVAYEIFMTKVSFYYKDRYFAPDIEAAKRMIKNDQLADLTQLNLLN